MLKKNMQKTTQHEQATPNKRFRLSPSLVITLGVWLIVALLGGIYIWKKIKIVEQETLQFEALQLTSNLEASLDRFKPIPGLIAATLTDISAIESSNPAGVNHLNHRLEQLNQSLGTEKIFLLNSEGVVVATSNAWKTDSVLGEDLSFRAFYQGALRGIDGNYHAVGTTNGRLGQYFSRSLFKGDKFLGVLVIKVNLTYAENIVDRPGRRFAVSDANGIIFLAEEKSWLFKLVPGVHVDDLHTVIGNRQYGGAEFSSELFRSDNVDFDEVVCILRDEQCDYYLHSYAVLLQNDWTVHLFRPISLLISKTVLFCTVLSLSYWLVVFFWLFYRSRMQHRKLLEGENKRLESRVQNLTVDLTNKNASLKNSINKLQQSNRELEETQRDLIFADRLALLGEVSVGLHHELNQPILAIKAYAENGVGFLEKSKLSEVEENLHEINDIADNMAAIIAQFKVFSKREHNSEEFDLHNILQGALLIAKPHLDKNNSRVSYEENTNVPKVRGNAVLIQQVMVNLIINAQQSVDVAKTPNLIIRIGHNSLICYFEVSDNGPGLPDEAKNRVFTPFFTTKSTGLGLGLSLSRKIVEINSGKIFVKESSSEGSTFRFELPIHPNEASQ